MLRRRRSTRRDRRWNPAPRGFPIVLIRSALGTREPRPWTYIWSSAPGWVSSDPKPVDGGRNAWHDLPQGVGEVDGKRTKRQQE
jgi:hypothetical protein